MKKILLLNLLLLKLLYSSEIEIGTKIIEKISISLTKKDPIKIYVNTSVKAYNLETSKYLVKVNNCRYADLILTKSLNIPNCNTNTLIFATSYLTFKSLPNAVGAFFYQKGRPNIIFREKILKNKDIVLDKEFDKYIE